MYNAWLIVVVAGLLEIIWALCIKRSDGCRHLWWTASGLIIAVISIVILSQAMRKLPAATSYAVWAGIGAAGTAIVSIMIFKESSSPIKVISLILIIAGIVGLRLEEGNSGSEPGDNGNSGDKRHSDQSDHQQPIQLLPDKSS